MKTAMTLRLPNSITARLDEIAAESGQSRHALIVRLLDEATRRDDGLSQRPGREDETVPFYSDVVVAPGQRLEDAVRDQHPDAVSWS